MTYWYVKDPDKLPVCLPKLLQTEVDSRGEIIAVVGSLKGTMLYGPSIPDYYDEIDDDLAALILLAEVP